MTLSLERRLGALKQAISFDAFVDGTVNYTEQFRDNHAAAQLDAADRSALATIDRPVDVIAIVEDWCPDVVATLPIVARIAEAHEYVNLHVLVRGEGTQDVADAYPFEGRSHIPTYVLFGADGEELGVFVERTAEIGEVLWRFLDEFIAAHPGLDRTNVPAGLTDVQKQELSGSSLARRAELRDLERSTLVRDLVAIATGRGAAVSSGAGLGATAAA